MAETTLRDQLTAAMDAAPEIEGAADPIAGQANQSQENTEQIALELKEANEARARDARGRFANAGATAPTTAAPAAAPAVGAPAATAQAVEPRKAPSSWKKDYWDDYAKLDPRLQDYLEQREREFASGVSTYRQEAEQARELREAIAPYHDELQSAGMSPGQWVSNVARTHQILVRGSAEQKVVMLQQLAASYQVPVQLAAQGPNGQWQLLAPRQAPAQQQQPQQQPQDVRSLVRDVLADEKNNSEVQAMAGDTANFPHFKAVAGTMAGLLRAGLAQDLRSAYDASLRLPAHADLAQQVAEQQRQATDQRRADEQRQTVARARANVVSPKTATPSANMATAGKKGLRDTLSEAVDAVSSGRV